MFFQVDSLQQRLLQGGLCVLIVSASRHHQVGNGIWTDPVSEHIQRRFFSATSVSGIGQRGLSRQPFGRSYLPGTTPATTPDVLCPEQILAAHAAMPSIRVTRRMEDGVRITGFHHLPAYITMILCAASATSARSWELTPAPCSLSAVAPAVVR